MKKLIALFAITGLIFTSCNNMQTNNSAAAGPSDEDRRAFREQIRTHNTFRKAFKEENIEMLMGTLLTRIFHHLTKLIQS